MPEQRSPCCDADLVLRSPPNNYECRECLAQYDLDTADLAAPAAEGAAVDDGDAEPDAGGDAAAESDTVAAADAADDEAQADADETAAEDQEICGAEMSDGSYCERPAATCPYHDEADRAMTEGN